MISQSDIQLADLINKCVQGHALIYKLIEETLLSGFLSGRCCQGFGHGTLVVVKAAACEAELHPEVFQHICR